jgi:ELWxxDGT repeat protein
MLRITFAICIVRRVRWAAGNAFLAVDIRRASPPLCGSGPISGSVMFHILRIALVMVLGSGTSALAAPPVPIELGSLSMLKNLNGAASGDPAGLVPAGTQLFFTLNDSVLIGPGLWVTDTTAAGTRLTKDIAPASLASPTFLDGAAAVGPVWIGMVQDAVTGRQIWRSDGTFAGTYALTAVPGGFDSQNPLLISPFKTIRGIAYACINTSYGGSIYGSEMWRTDGTVAGTFMLKDLNPGAGSGCDSAPVEAGAVVYFRGDNGTTGWELFRTDGTTAGTLLVKDVNPNGAVSSNPRQLTAMGTRLYFVADNGVVGAELWVSDGTDAGTNVLKDLYVGPASSNVTGLTAVNDTLWFWAVSSASGASLFKSDGTTAGTVFVALISMVDDQAPAFVDTGGVVLFRATNDQAALEIWRTDGTPAGTYLVKDVEPAPFTSSAPVFGPMVNGRRLFTANTALYGRELWVTDGTTAGTQLLLDAFPLASSGSPSQFTKVGGLVYFTAGDSSFDTELYRTDGTPAGTARVADLCPGANGSRITQVTAFKGRVYFSGSDCSNGDEIWQGPVVNSDTQRISITAAGRSDILFQHSSGPVYGWAMNGAALLAASPLFNFGAGWVVKGIGDLDGDGKDDVVVREVGGYNKVVRLSASGSSISVTDVKDINAVGLNWAIAAVADFDGDGKDDILWREVAGYHWMFSRYNPATGAVVENAVPGLGVDWKIAAVADFDSDGRADIFWRNINGANAIWYMNGPSIKKVSNVAGLGIDWQFAGLADFDGDGVPDVFWRNINGANGIWFLSADGSIARVANVTGVDTAWKIVAIGDYNGDGRPDLLWENAQGLRVTWQMDAENRMAEGTIPGTGPGWTVIYPTSPR